MLSVPGLLGGPVESPPSAAVEIEVCERSKWGKLEWLVARKSVTV